MVLLSRSLLLLLLVLSCSCIALSYHLPAVGPRTKLTTSTQRFAGSFPGFEVETFHKNQWELYLQHHVGRWVGIQAGYDPDLVEIEDYMYCETLLEKNVENTQVKHISSLVLGEIRADCEVCFDSERLKSKEVGTYSLGNLRSRVCANVDVRGPALTPRGISTELIVRHDDGRVRVLLAHSPIDFVELEGVGSVPSAYALKDIVIVRERLEKRPLKSDDNPDIMWQPTVDGIFSGSFAGNRQRFSAQGVVESEMVSFASLPACQVLSDEVKELLVSSSTSDEQQNDHKSSSSSNNNSNNSGDIYKRVFDGGIMIEAPWIIAAGLEVRARVSWVPCGGRSSKPVLYAADVGLLAVAEVTQLPAGNTILVPPELVDFYVETLTK